MSIQRAWRLTVVVPIYQNNKAVQPDERFADLETVLVERYGGFTRTNCVGQWITDEGVVQEDEGLLYEVTTIAPRTVAEKDWELLLRRLRVLFEQEAMYGEMSDTTQFLVED